MMIADFLASFIEVLVCAIFCGSFLKEKWFEYRVIFVVSVFGAVAISIINGIAIFSVLTSVLAYLILFACVVVIYQKKPFLIFLYVLAYLPILMSCDFFVIVVAQYLTKSSVNILGLNYLRTVCMFVSKAFSTITVVAIIKLRFEVVSISKKIIIIMSLFSMISFVLLTLVAELYLYNSSSHMEIGYMIPIVVLTLIIIFVIITFVIFQKISSEHKKEKEYLAIKARNEYLEKAMIESHKSFDVWKKVIHDFKNQIYYIDELLRSRDYSMLQGYIRELKVISNEAATQIKTGNKYADAIIAEKTQVAKNLSIDVILNAQIPDKIPLKDYELCTIVGNAFDNAIEATQFAKEKNIQLTIKPVKGFLCIKLSNTVDCDPLIDNPNLLSTKEDKGMHGIGVKSIRDMCEGHDASINYYYDDGYFVLYIMIPEVKSTKEAK